MENKIKKAELTELIEEMTLGELVEEMCQQLIMQDTDLNRSEAFSFSHDKNYSDGQERKEQIREKYEPTLTLLRKQLDLYHK